MSRKYNDFMNWYSSLSSVEQSDVDMLADDLGFPLYPECSDEELDILETSSPSSSKTDPMMDTYVVKIWHENGEEVFSIPANSPSAAINDAKRIWTGPVDRLEIIDVNPEYGDEPQPLPFKAATDVMCGKDMYGNEVDWIVDAPIPDDPSFNRRMLDLELADEEDFYDKVHHEGDYEDDDYDYAADYDEVITSTCVEANTRDKISYLQDRISELEDQLKRDYYLDPDKLIDTQLELEDLREQLNFAWQDDEAEYNYALQQQEFNPDGSLRGYDDIYESTQVTASSEWAASWDKRKYFEDDGAPYYIMSVPSGTARVLPNDVDGSRYHVEIKFRNGENRRSVAFEDYLEAMDWAEKLLDPASVNAATSIEAVRLTDSWTESFNKGLNSTVYTKNVGDYEATITPDDNIYTGEKGYYAIVFDTVTRKDVQESFSGDRSLNAAKRWANEKMSADINASTTVTASTFPETISIKLYPNAAGEEAWVTYTKDYEHEDGGCYYHSDDVSNPVTSQFISLYPDGSLTYLWDGVEKPFNKEWREEVPIYSSTSVTASKFIDNDKIQKGLIWNRDWHQFTVQSISPDHKTCKVSEEWIAEDSGEEIKRVYTYKIEEDEEGKEYCYDPKYEEYKDEWWGKMYAQGADNYEFDWDMRSKKLDEAYEKARNNDSKYVETEEDNMIDDELLDDEYYDEDYTPSATHGDYSPSNPWDAPGMSIKDFI